MPLELPSLPETARGFFGNLSTNIRLRTNAVFASTLQSLDASPKSATASSISSSATSISSSLSCSSSQSSSPPTSLRERSNSNSSHSMAQSPTNPREVQPVNAVDERECLQDAEVKLEMPNKKRFDPGFLFHSRNRSGSVSSIFSNLSNLSTSFRQSNQKTPPQQQQQQQQKKPQMSKLRQTQEAPSTTSISQPHSEPPEATSFKSLAVPRRNKSRRPSVVKATDLDSGAGVDQGTKTKAGSETDIDIKAEPNATVEADTETPQARNGTHLASPRLLPKTVVIRGLPKYSPGDDIGRNAKRNEVYARIRLMALREHQQVLVKLLSDLLDIDRMTHQNQTQDRCQDSCHPIESQSAKSGSATKASDHNECRHIQRHQRCDIAMHEYQKAIIDLWQADQNMSYWLIRYIRTTRRIGRSFEFMFEEPLIDGAPAVPTDLKSTQTTADSESTQATADPESTQATTDSESAQATSEESDASATTTDSESTQATTGFKSIQDASKESGAAGSPRGLSNFDLERVGILMPKLLKFSADGRKRDTFITTKLLGADKNTRKAPMRSSSLMAFRHFQPSDNRDSILKIHQKPLPKIPTESQDTNTSANPEVVASETVAAPVEPPQLLLPAAPTRPPPAIPAPSPPGVTRPTTPVSTTLLSILPSPPISPPPPLPTTLYSTAPVSLTASKRLRSCLQPQEARQDENQKQPQANATSGTSSMPGSRIRPRFQDFDDLEALIFVGLHMQSLQKSREFLNQFNKESARSRVAIERFEIAKQEYELRVLAKPSWKSKEQRRDPQQFNRAFVEAF